MAPWRDHDELGLVLRSNVYPICQALLATESRQALALTRGLPNAARIVINEDPSREVYAEPWGAYGHSGNGKVATWLEKYTRTVQVVSSPTHA